MTRKIVYIDIEAECKDQLQGRDEHGATRARVKWLTAFSSVVKVRVSRPGVRLEESGSNGAGVKRMVY